MDTMNLTNGIVFTVDEHGNVGFSMIGNVSLGALCTAATILQRQAFAWMDAVEHASNGKSTTLEVVQSIPEKHKRGN